MLVTADSDVQDAVAVAKHQGKDRVLLVLHGGKSWEEAASRSSAYSDYAQSAASLASAHRQKHHASSDAPARAAAGDAPGAPKAAGGNNDLLFGVIPKDLALPAAISFLGVAVIGAVAMTRMNAR